ncbi:hypothetical protein ACQP1G_31165 [Nocardia sp. CA-107356]|uniref:hypothetical protein n=1 Tax=Nocardia sp. CA-107356 TaxID=3239972 RepID=UPI003D8F17AD
MNLITEPDRVREVLTSAPMPAVPRTAQSVGIGWLRATVARFCDGLDHERRRALVVAELARLSPEVLRERVRTVEGELPHVRVLAQALGIQDISVSAVAVAAAHYQPHEPDSAEADRAVAELVAACGAVADERTAARISLLIQACQATGALVDNARRFEGTGTADEIIARTMVEDPPVRRTRRVVEGAPVEVDLTGLGFGAGPHICPGRDHALAMAAGIIERS